MNIKDTISKVIAPKALADERWVALLAWAILAALCLYLLGLREQSPFFSAVWMLSAAAFLVFIISFYLATEEKPYPAEPWFRVVLMALQVLAIFCLYYLVPYNFTAILMTLFVAQLPYYLSIKRSILVSVALSLPHWFIYQFFWNDDYSWISALLFCSFNLFSIVSMGARLNETKALEREQSINRELRATQLLLQEASKQNERTRIARNIHDLLGHHLTALSINLQVASRQSDENTKNLLDKSQSITKLLLSDVREAVSDLRDSATLDIRQALESLSQTSDNKSVTVSCTTNLLIQRINIAEVILRVSQEATTNFLRHSNGNELSIRVFRQGRELKLEIADNGKVKSICEGNGLKGIRERAEQIGGQVNITPSMKGFRLTLTVEDE
ncbi:sensor histidine kinase [Idiomarina sp.]|uniref:sensor histidine kinase n=1 Tax=Idiomarina sp. TaxID=1874361 RepID=UPI003A9259CB